MLKPTCPRCDDEEDCLEVTNFGDMERKYVIGRPCECPGPRCFACHTRLDGQLCDNRDCYMWRLVVPLPEYA